MTATNYQRGFSMIETVFYVAIIGVVIVAAVAMAFGAIQSFNRLKATANLARAGEAALARLEYEIRRAESINLGASVLNNHPGVLALNTQLTDGTPATVNFFIQNDTLMITDTAGIAYPLLPLYASTTEFIARQITASSSSGVAVTLKLYDLRQPESLASFMTSAVMRGSY